MNLNNLFDGAVNGVATDFKAEVVAAEMIQNNIPADRIMIVPVGAMHRAGRKDVESVTEEIPARDNKEYYIIRTPKEGLYDKLPENLFHTPISYTSGNNELEVIEAIRQHRREEKAARTFFMPFDVALNHVRIQLALYEKQLDEKFHYNRLVNIFSPHWEIFRHLTIYQANIFLQYLPVIHRIRDDWETIADVLELMFLAPARLELQTIGSCQKANEQTRNFIVPGLGESELGVDFTPGHPLDSGEFSEMLITFGPLTAKKVGEFTGSLQQEKIVHMLCDYLLPADLDVVVNYELAADEQAFVLADGSENCEMGVSVYL